jgi:hypothetical protein
LERLPLNLGHGHGLTMEVLPLEQSGPDRLDADGFHHRESLERGLSRAMVVKAVLPPCRPGGPVVLADVSDPPLSRESAAPQSKARRLATLQIAWYAPTRGC